MQYAGFWRRFFAMIVDSLLATIVGGLALVAMGAIVFGAGILTGAPGDRMLAAMYVATASLGTVFWILYYAAFESSASGATPGKRLLGIAVTDAQGGRIGFGQAFGRNVCKLLSAITLYVGFLMAAFTSRKQALHDIMTGCLVVRR